MISLNQPLPSGDGQLLDLVGAIDDPSAAPEASDEMAHALARLCPLERALLLACHRDELTVQEAALRLGVAVSTVERRLRKAERRAAGVRKPRPRGHACEGAGVERPVGTVRVRSCKRRVYRLIKVRMDPPLWAPYARWLWERHRGPVPQGKYVIHLDGDTLNDDPGNLALGTHADRAFLGQERLRARGQDPYAATRAGAAAHNRERRAARDLLGELRVESWYAADHPARVITGPYGKQCHLAYDALGVPRPAGWDRNRRSWLPAQLGWPSLCAYDALALHCLAEAGGAGALTAGLAAAVVRLSALLGCPLGVPMPQSAATACHALRKAGLARSSRGGEGRGQSRHWALPAALGLRGPACLLAVVKGREAQLLKDDGYRVLTPEQLRREREAPPAPPPEASTAAPAHPRRAPAPAGLEMPGASRARLYLEFRRLRREGRFGGDFASWLAEGRAGEP